MVPKILLMPYANTQLDNKQAWYVSVFALEGELNRCLEPIYKAGNHSLVKISCTVNAFKCDVYLSEITRNYGSPLH